MDALRTQRHVAQTMVDEGGDYVMIVKENQPQLRADIELVFTLPPAGDRQETARTVDIGHSTKGKRDGLYWEAPANEPPSPFYEKRPWMESSD